MLDSQEHAVHEERESESVERLCRLLMMMKTRTLPLKSLYPMKWDLGLPDNFDKVLVPKYPDCFRFVKASNGLSCLRLEQWREEFAVSVLERSNEGDEVGNEYRQFKKGETGLAFPLNFPRGYGAQKKVRAWMEDFQKLPYVSPYEDSRHIDPNSDLMEKRVVGVLHEILSLALHKKTKRNYFRSMREELNLPHKFTRIFTRYPGIFYLSLKCKTTTVALREGYHRGKLVNPHPLTRLREKFYHVMRTGLIFRGKGENLLPKEDILDGGESEDQEGDSEEEEEVEMDDEFSKEISELEDSEED